MIYHMSSSHYSHHGISLVWNECTSMQLGSQWGYVHCKSFPTLAVVQWSDDSCALVMFLNIVVVVNTVIADLQCNCNSDEVYYTSANIGISKSNNNNYEWIQWIKSHFNHNHPVVSASVSSQSIVWNVSLCDYQ